MIVAGEASGDMHAAHLVSAIKKIDPHIKFSGLGGQRMEESGVTLYEDLVRLAVVGFIEVVKHYSDAKKIFHAFLKKVSEVKPNAVILVDYPGFNLRLAKELKKLNVKVIYYISPQVWAWKESRVQNIKAFTDKMIVLFDFEKKFYAKYGLEVDYVGHPLIDSIKVTNSKENVLESAGLSKEKLTIGILPGSRQKEIQTILPTMLKTASILQKEFSNIQFILVKASTIDKQTLERMLRDSNSHNIKILEKNGYNAINACDICMVASGTATLETAVLKKPMVIVYKTSLVTWLLAKLFIKIPFIGLVNVVAGKKIVPECIQFKATGENIATALKNIFTDEIKDADIKSELKKVKDILGGPGASQRAAEHIISFIS